MCQSVRGRKEEGGLLERENREGGRRREEREGVRGEGKRKEGGWLGERR